MKKIYLVLLIFTSLFSYSQVDTLKHGNVKVIGDSEITEILNSKSKNTTQKTKSKVSVKKSKSVETIQAVKPRRSEAEIVQIEKLKSARRIDVCYKRDKLDGVKIKIGITKTLQEANNLKKQAISLFPFITTPEIKDVRPHYHVMIGDYFSKHAARKHFALVKKKYPNAVLVNWRVYCRKAMPNGE